MLGSILLLALSTVPAFAGPCAQCDESNTCILKETQEVFQCPGIPGGYCAQNASLEHGDCGCLQEACGVGKMPPPGMSMSDSMVHECYNKCEGGAIDCESQGLFEPSCLYGCLKQCIESGGTITPTPPGKDKCAACDKTGFCQRHDDKATFNCSGSTEAFLCAEMASRDHNGNCECLETACSNRMPPRGYTEDDKCVHDCSNYCEGDVNCEDQIGSEFACMNSCMDPCIKRSCPAAPVLGNSICAICDSLHSCERTVDQTLFDCSGTPEALACAANATTKLAHGGGCGCLEAACTGRVPAASTPKDSLCVDKCYKRCDDGDETTSQKCDGSPTEQTCLRTCVGDCLSTCSPTAQPTEGVPSKAPTEPPTHQPTEKPVVTPTKNPTEMPTVNGEGIPGGVTGKTPCANCQLGYCMDSSTQTTYNCNNSPEALDCALLVSGGKKTDLDNDCSCLETECSQRVPPAPHTFAEPGCYEDCWKLCDGHTVDDSHNVKQYHTCLSGCVAENCTAPAPALKPKPLLGSSADTSMSDAEARVRVATYVVVTIGAVILAAAVTGWLWKNNRKSWCKSDDDAIIVDLNEDANQNLERGTYNQLLSQEIDEE